ncbi:DUF4238 domain-containing protein [Candidatus Falkowbacteria bacterium]|nr:DUF4238 domain-containing protein [Candidatus Falkowbacteria bacterium]
MGEVNKQITAKQHFVPKFYLKRFANKKGFVEVLDLNNRRIGSARPFGSVCYEHYFYGLETGKCDDISQEIEDLFKVLEDKIAPKYNIFIEKVLSNSHIEEKDMYYAACFMSMLWIRSKYFRENVNKMNNDALKKINKLRASDGSFENYLKETIKKRGDDSIRDEDIKLYKDLLISGDYDLKFSNKHHLLFLKNMEGFSNLFFAKNWRAYFAPADYSFITSDTPISEMVPKRSGFWGSDFLSRTHYLALTPKVIIELVNPISGKKFKRKRIEKVDVIKFNLMRADLSLEYCYSQTRNEFEDMIKVVEYKN